MTLKLFPFIFFLHTFLLELCNGATISSCITNERNALLDFKKNIIDEQDRLASWTHEDCCKWEGVSCNNSTGHVVSLDLRNPHHFDEIREDNVWSFRGQLSSSLLDLKHLNYLDLSMNHFDGHIPKFVGSLHNLRYLNLSLAGFIGLIPPHLGNLTRLKYLDLNNGWPRFRNGFIVGHDARWVSRLISLKHLTMKNTKFENFQNWMEALNTLPNIAELCLSNGYISAFPVSLPCANFTNLSYLDLSENQIVLESIPLWLFNIKSLTHIDLHSNYFRSIPDAINNLTSLEYIDFARNRFSGTLPQVLKSLKENIEHLNLRGNGFNGSLPDWFVQLHKLKILDLSYNSLSGCIPDSFGELHKLKTLVLSFNSLSSCIPESLGRLAALQYLGLRNNKLNGTVPKSIGQLSNLVTLDLGYNHLEGVISDVYFASLTKLKGLSLTSNNIILNVSGDWIPPFKLKGIDMGSCKLGPKFPAWLQTQANISYLNLSSSGIVDTLPNWFRNVFATYSDYETILLDLSNNGITGSLPSLPKLCFSYFDLSSNHFKGPLPTSLNVSSVVDLSNNSFSGSVKSATSNNGRMMYINLSRNNFSGEIPSSVCLPYGEWIDLSWNLLTGELPNCWNRFVDLSHLPLACHIDFSRNNLSGSIPHTFGSLPSLISLHMSYNNISGNIPTTLRNCTYLEVLDLGMNKLTGIIPTWVGESFTNLQILVLRSNNFTGNVPSNLSNMTRLQVLDLGNNKLSGSIPRSFGNFTVMMNKQSYYRNYTSNLMRVGDNYVEYVQLYTKGRGWTYDRLLSQITIVDLSFNNLSGYIPKELGNLQDLIFLNLSGNHLVGSIPYEIGLMHSLEDLDLSSNGLSGSIPLSMSTMTMLSSLNLRCNNLSGKIPTGSQLQTFTNESYIGNPKLCGFPLTKSCDSNNKTINDEAPADEVTVSDYWYVSIASGFVFGSWIVCGTFFVKKNWRDAYFQSVDCLYDAIKTAIITVKIRIARKGDETTTG